MAHRTTMKVGLDVDGTLAMSFHTIIDYYNSVNKTGYTIKDLGGWSKNWNIPMSLDEYHKLYDKIWTQRWWGIKPSIGSKDLSALASSHNVEIVTARPTTHEPFVNCWLNAHFPGISLNLKITPRSEEKVHMGYDILLDDGNPVAEEMIRNGNGRTRLILIEQPWNMKEHYESRSPKIEAVKDLQEGISLLLRRAGNNRAAQSRMRTAR
ncbi:MAG: hypothetical protein KGH94_03325 [Candidatus Micrarchaeota archaeon]|nr:hypothetical protein [Candidatus Micrarchaeota archaeon]